ncbi:MAG: signal peptidase I [Clostridia bacterium]|nr:signal peptidase I [Clostridia bacterium]
MDNNSVVTKKSTPKKIAKIIGNILAVIYVIAVLLISFTVFTSMKTGHASLFGYSFHYVLTDSMESERDDAIFEGDLVICHSQDDFYNIADDKIIAYETEVYQKDENGDIKQKRIVRIHRILEKDETGVRYITVGDNSPDNDKDGFPDPDDAPVPPNNIIGIYTGIRIPGVGAAFEFLRTPNGILIFLVIPMSAFFIYALYKFVKTMIEYKLEKATSGAPADGELTEEQKQAAIAEYLAKQAAEANKDENNTDNTSEE